MGCSIVWQIVTAFLSIQGTSRFDPIIYWVEKGNGYITKCGEKKIPHESREACHFQMGNFIIQVCRSLHKGANSKTANWTTLLESFLQTYWVPFRNNSTTVECTVYYLVKQQSIAASNQIANCTLTMQLQMLGSWG